MVLRKMVFFHVVLKLRCNRQKSSFLPPLMDESPKFMEFEVGIHDDAYEGRFHSHVPFIGPRQ